jgi:hypothetical protein
MNRARRNRAGWWRIGASFLVLAVLAGCKPVTEPQPSASPEPVVFSESLYERYVEHYDSNIGPLESWVYGSGEKLKEYSVYKYTDGRLSGVFTYNSATVVDASTLISRLGYTYDALGNVIHGEIQANVDGAMLTRGSYDASYNARGRYLDYLEKDGSGAVVEHRVCVYDASGDNYLVETYYSDAGTANMKEQYHCVYDAADTWKWIREDHYIKLGGGVETTGNPAYERRMVYTYTWNGYNMYLQSDFDEAGDMVVAIMYTFENGMKKTRSYINQDGSVVLYRTYQYDDAGNLIELRFFNQSKPVDEQLELRETYRLYQEGTDKMFEKTIYTYGHASKGLGRPEIGTAVPVLIKPEASYHRQD